MCAVNVEEISFLIPWHQGKIKNIFCTNPLILRGRSMFPAGVLGLEGVGWRGQVPCFLFSVFLLMVQLFPRGFSLKGTKNHHN